MDKERIILEESWKLRLQDQFDQTYMRDLRNFLVQEYKSAKIIYPQGNEYFAALNIVPFNNVRVVIVGQDPYHGPGQAHGLCFSVKPGVTLPPSLKNIFKELQNDLGCAKPDHGCLIPWARQGVVLLNSVLTVRQGEPGAHRGKGWERFTDRVIQIINDEKENVIFVLWGAYAQDKGKIIDRNKHLVLEAAHPSPFSADRGFYGCRHFSRINDHLTKIGQKPIEWALPSKELVLQYLPESK
jgi:uracil-DNA glycosylase